MLAYFFALLVAAAVVLAVDMRNAANRWAAFFLSFAAIGGLADTAADAGLQGVARGIQFLNLTVTPYGVLMFAIVYTGMAERRRRVYSLAKWLLLLPVPAMLATGLATPGAPVRYDWLLPWCGPYILFACYLLVRSLWLERDSHRRKSRFATTILFVPTLLAVLSFIYVARVFTPDFAFFGYVSFFVLYSLAAGLLLAFAYGVLGVKLRFERDPLESAMKAASSGTNLLNHTIKNEIGKISLSADNLRHALPERGNSDADQHLQIIERASNQMLAMVTRIHGRTKEIVLREQAVRLDLLAETAVLELRERIRGRDVSVSLRLGCRPTVICDPVHIREALGNLLDNAVEASPASGGRIVVRLETGKRELRLAVDDNGPGISRGQASRAFDPFYSTKNSESNYGLGLSYVYNVMRAIGGTAELASREGGGATAALVFPMKKVVRENGDGVNGGGENGE